VTQRLQIINMALACCVKTPLNSLQLDPILRLMTLQLQRQRCNSLQRFQLVEKILVFKMSVATGSVVNFYSAGVVTRGRSIGCELVNKQANTHTASPLDFDSK
jgi:hypothetical protein